MSSLGVAPKKARSRKGIAFPHIRRQSREENRNLDILTTKMISYFNKSKYRPFAICFLLFAICFLPVSGFGQSVVFRDVAVESGLKFQHFTGATGDLFMPEIMGSGCVLFDYDNDGDLDVFLIQGTLLDDKKNMSAASSPLPKDWQPGNRLFRNEFIPSGKLRFTDVTDKASLHEPQPQG